LTHLSHSTQPLFPIPLAFIVLLCSLLQAAAFSFSLFATFLAALATVLPILFVVSLILFLNLSITVPPS
jgi:hypothetical protein